MTEPTSPCPGASASPDTDRQQHHSSAGPQRQPRTQEPQTHIGPSRSALALPVSNSPAARRPLTVNAPYASAATQPCARGSASAHPSPLRPPTRLCLHNKGRDVRARALRPLKGGAGWLGVAAAQGGRGYGCSPVPALASQLAAFAPQQGLLEASSVPLDSSSSPRSPTHFPSPPSAPQRVMGGGSSTHTQAQISRPDLGSP